MDTHTIHHTHQEDRLTQPFAVIVCTNSGTSAQQQAAAEAALMEDNTILHPESNAPRNVSCLAISRQRVTQAFTV